MFATRSLARRIEHAEAALVGDGAAAAAARPRDDGPFVRRLNGGVAAFTEPGAPLNKVIGLGFDGVPSASDLAEVEAAYAARGCPVTVELSSFADPEFGRLLTRRGYELIAFENVSGVPLDAGPHPAPPAGIDIQAVGDADAESWLETVTVGFQHQDVYDGNPSHEAYNREVVRRAVNAMAAVEHFERFVARRGGELAGGASFRCFQGVAQMCGSATLPAHRRRGVQTALLHHRLAAAARAGCDVAVVTTQAGSKSQQNVERFGFGLLYVRAILTRGDAATPLDAH